MNEKTVITLIVILIILVVFVFFAPVVPMTGELPAAGAHYHYFGSLSSLISNVGTSYVNGHYYFTVHYNPDRAVP